MALAPTLQLVLLWSGKDKGCDTGSAQKAAAPQPLVRQGVASLLPEETELFSTLFLSWVGAARGEDCSSLEPLLGHLTGLGAVKTPGPCSSPAQGEGTGGPGSVPGGEGALPAALGCEASSQRWSSLLWHKKMGLRASLPQNQEDGEHLEGRKGKPHALLLQRQGLLGKRLLQEVTAGEEGSW